MDRYVKFKQEMEAVMVPYILACIVSLVPLTPYYPQGFNFEIFQECNPDDQLGFALHRFRVVTVLFVLPSTNMWH